MDPLVIGTIVLIHTKYLPHKDALNFLSTSKHTWDNLKWWAETNITFRVPNKCDTFTTIMPRKLIVRHISSASRETTHLEINSGVCGYDYEPSGLELPVNFSWACQFPNLVELSLNGRGITLNDLPNSIRTVKINFCDIFVGQERDSSIVPGLLLLPSCLTELDLAATVTFDDLDNLPSALKVLKISVANVGSMDNLPKAVNCLHLKSAIVCCSLDNLPPGLVELVLPETFNQPIDHLPRSLRILHLGDSFNLPIDYLPSTLETLQAGRNFNQPVDYLPRSLTRLTLGVFFNQPVDHLPAGLIFLDLTSKFNFPIDHLPESLSKLTLGRKFQQCIDHLPASLRNLILLSDLKHELFFLPPDLKHLSITPTRPLKWLYVAKPYALSCFEVSLGHITGYVAEFYRNFTPLDLNIIGLTTFKVCGSHFNIPIDALPESVVSVSITSADFNQPIPPHLKHLVSLAIRGQAFNQSLDCLSTSLKSLIIVSNVFNTSMDLLPSSLERLEITSPIFDKSIDMTRLTSLESLHVHAPRYKRPVLHLPLPLARLCIAPAAVLNLESLPPSVRLTLYICDRLYFSGLPPIPLHVFTSIKLDKSRIDFCHAPSYY